LKTAARTLLLALAAYGPLALASPPAPTPAPKDRPYPGAIELTVTATDTDRRIIHVRESLSGISGETVLLYPKWLPGTHAPQGAIDRVAGLRFSAGDTALRWTRDPLDVYAFQVHAPQGVTTIEAEFDYLSPTSTDVGPIEISPEIAIVEWINLVLYPAGYYAHRIPVGASLALPAGWEYATALETVSSAGGQVRFRPEPLDVFVDSPVYAGRHSARFDLDPGAKVPVRMSLFADRPQLLEVKPEQLQAYRDLVKQAYALYGARHYAHYDFLYSLSDRVQQQGLEHHQSSEDGADPESFTEWDKTAYDRDLLPHEFTHSWNGKFRRPADLWTPNYSVPMQDSLLWVYEGQTQYWGEVLSARSGLLTRQQALDSLALTAAFYDRQAGRQWRPVQDTTNDEIINPRRPMSWRSWQRFEDYYSEGALIWLEADTLIRERSQGKRSLDDFARGFFGVQDGNAGEFTYTFDDVVRTLNDVEPYDWAGFLHSRVEGIGRAAPLQGLAQGGYRLVYTDTPNELQKATDGQLKRTGLGDSLGLGISEKDGTVTDVTWDGPAFKAGLAESTQLVAVNGQAYSGDAIKEAIKAAKDKGPAIELIVKNGERYRVVSIDYHGGLRYPHLERVADTPARLDDILAPRH
jgi:predicted metalloprotease with PDZ domain